MSTQKYDFSKMRWRIDEVPVEESIYVKYPELYERMAEYRGKMGLEDTEEEKIVRYIIFCYHQYSPLITKIDDVILRKKQALLLSGIEVDDDGNFSEEIVSIIKNEHEEVGRAIIHFLKFENSVRHMTIMMQTEALYQYNLDLLSPRMKGADKKSTIASIQELEANLDRLTNIHYKGDGDLINFVASSKVLEERAIITPEDYATAAKIR